MKRYVKASIGTLEQQEQAEGMAMVLPRKALLRARLDVVMVLPQKAPLQARPQEPLQARPQEPLWEPQSEMVQAFITQSEAQPSEILRPLLQFRPTACVVHAEGSYAAEAALAAITLTGFGCGPEFPPLSIVARARLADCRRHRRLSASAGVAASRRPSLVEEQAACFVVRDTADKSLAYVYFGGCFTGRGHMRLRVKDTSYAQSSAGRGGKWRPFGT
jgi:hypothetical protein